MAAVLVLDEERLEVGSGCPRVRCERPQLGVLPECHRDGLVEQICAAGAVADFGCDDDWVGIGLDVRDAAGEHQCEE